MLSLVAVDIAGGLLSRRLQRDGGRVSSYSRTGQSLLGRRGRYYFQSMGSADGRASRSETTSVALRWF
jgi:hypothetical protein